MNEFGGEQEFSNDELKKMSRAELENQVKRNPDSLRLLRELALRYEDEGWQRDGQDLTEFLDNFLHYPILNDNNRYRQAIVDIGPVTLPFFIDGLAQRDFELKLHALIGIEYLGERASAAADLVLDLTRLLIRDYSAVEVSPTLTSVKRLELLTQAFKTGLAIGLVTELTDLCQKIHNAPEADTLLCLRVFQKLERKFLSALPIIRKCLLSSSRSIRLLAIECLNNFRSEQHLWREHAERLLGDSLEATTRFNLTQLLESCRNPQNDDRFELLKNRVVQSRDAERSIHALQRLVEDFRGHSKLPDLLRKCLASQHGKVQGLALQVLIEEATQPRTLVYDYLYDAPLQLRLTALQQLIRLCEGRSDEVWEVLPQFFEKLNLETDLEHFDPKTEARIFQVACHWVLTQSNAKNYVEFLRQNIVPRVTQFEQEKPKLKFPKLYELALNRLASLTEELFLHGQILSWQQTDTLARLAFASHLPSRHLENYLKPHLVRWAHHEDLDVIRALRLRLHWAPRMRRAFVNKLIEELTADFEVLHSGLFEVLPQSLFQSSRLSASTSIQVGDLDPVSDRDRLLAAADSVSEVSPDLAEKLSLAYITASQSSRRSILRALKKSARPEPIHGLLEQVFAEAGEEEQRYLIQAAGPFLRQNPDDPIILNALEQALQSDLWIVCYEAIRQLGHAADNNYRAYSLCLKGLEHESPTVRQTAIEALLQLSDKPNLFNAIFGALVAESNTRNRSLVFDLLEKWQNLNSEQNYLIFRFILLDPDWAIRSRAYEILEQRSVIEEELFDALVQNLFKYTSYDNRHQTLALLSRVENRSDEFSVVLRRLLNEADPAIWGLALNYVNLRSLSGQALKAMRPYIRLMLRSRSDEHRRGALGYLRDDRTLARFLVAEIAALVNQKTHDEVSNQARRLLLKLCSKHADACRTLIRLAREDRHRRWLIARILQQSAPSRCDKLLAVLIADLRGLVTAEQINIAASIFPRCKNAVQVLQEMSESLPVNEEVTLIETLPMTPSFAIGKLIRCVSSNDKILAMRACKLLGRVRTATSDVLNALNGALANNDDKVKHAAMNAIRDLSHRRSVSTRYQR